MSSKRGRKRNDNLPPNRARDVQRAFRARRAAHLEALEHRVAELEEENNTLRAALSLPPANRPLLGKGPTGKDKPKPYNPRPSGSLSSTEPAASSSGLPSANSMGHMGFPPGSRTESPSSGSTRTHSLSPSSMTAALNNSTQPPVMPDGSGWDDGMFGGRDRADVQPSPVSTSYPVTPVSTTASQNPYPFPNSGASSSRQSVGQTYSLQLAQNYSHSADRPAESYSDSLFDRRFPFPSSAFQSAHDSSHTTFHAQSPTSAVSIPPHRGGANVSPMTYSHRRSITEPQALRSALMSSLPGMMQSGSGSTRGLSPPNMTETVGHLRAAEFDVDPRVNQMNTLPS